MIGLMDCNNFFVSCERLFRPDLRTKPVAVLSSNDGCIVARSNEVKAMGIPMGIPLFQAKKLVDMDQVTLFSSNFTLYRDISARVMQTLADEVSQIDQYSVDEAFFRADGLSETDAIGIRQRVIQKTGIPVSIGLAFTKTLAKVASKVAKKQEGVCVLTSDMWRELAPETSCSDIWGLGRATTAKLAELDIKTAAEFMLLERRYVRKLFGVGGERIFDELHGVSVHGLGEHAADSRQSLTSSRSFAQATQSIDDLKSAVAYHVAQVGAKLRSQKLVTTMVYVELRASRHSDFAYRKGGVEVALERPTNSTQMLTQSVLRTVEKFYDSEVPYKKAGITVAGLIPEDAIAISLFDTEPVAAKTTLDDVLDSLQKKFGFDALHSGAILPSKDRSSVRLRSQSYTTSWGDIPTVRA